jgi:hypothetical protein
MDAHSDGVSPGGGPPDTTSAESTSSESGPRTDGHQRTDSQASTAHYPAVAAAGTTAGATVTTADAPAEAAGRPSGGPAAGRAAGQPAGAASARKPADDRLLPDITTDERDIGWGDMPDLDDDHYLREVPPHHGG